MYMMMRLFPPFANYASSLARVTCSHHTNYFYVCFHHLVHDAFN